MKFEKFLLSESKKKKKKKKYPYYQGYPYGFWGGGLARGFQQTIDTGMGMGDDMGAGMGDMGGGDMGGGDGGGGDGGGGGE